MNFKIKIDDCYDSSKLLFSIPVHENQQVINNQIENILNNNPNSKIILHINQSFKNFVPNFTKYNNLFINSNRHNYIYGKGLLWIHVSNFLECMKQNIDFNYFVILSSNEMFIRKGLISYIEEVKNGVQLVKNDINIDWHNFKKNIEKEPQIHNLLNDFKMDTFYGGQTEGQFYEKNIFLEISDIYFKYFGNNEIHNFETEEIAIQTIFKNFNLNYGLPFTLQNYSNNLVFDEKLIQNIIKNKIIIPNNQIKGNLYSPHINQDCKSIYSIKRVDRTFNNIRNYLSRNGFILNKDIYQLNTYYYSNNSSLILYSHNHIYFKKNKSNSILNFHWFGYEIDPGYYNINFDIKTLNEIINIDKIGLKIHYPHEIIYNFFLNNLEVNIWKNISFPLSILQKQYIVFIFDDYTNYLNIEFKNINISKSTNNGKENIGLVLYENNDNKNDNKNNNYSINYTNIHNMIIDPFLKIYNIYKFVSVFNNINNQNLNQIANSYIPHNLLYLNNNSNINDIFINNTSLLMKYKEEHNINFKFIIYIRLDSIFKKNIIDFNFYINKFNFISYHIPYINNAISNSYDFMSIPYKYINKFYDFIKNNRENKNICYSIYSNLKNEIDNINFIYDDNYTKDIRTPLIKYLSDVSDVYDNKGYLFNKKYLYNIFYINNFSKILRNIDNEYYFFKKSTHKFEYFQWIGLYIDYFQDKNNLELIDITINFDIKLLKKINNSLNNEYGIKTHEPLYFNNDWINNCEINIYKKIELNLKIYKKNQYILLNFDNILDPIEFYIKNFKIILNYE